MLQVIQRVGTALPIYIDRLPALLDAGSSLVAVHSSSFQAVGLGHPSGLCGGGAWCAWVLVVELYRGQFRYPALCGSPGRKDRLGVWLGM